MPNTPPFTPENPESLQSIALQAQASTGLTETIKSDISELLDTETTDEF